MSDAFEKLEKIAEEEFGYKIVKSEKKTDIKKLFGFNSEEIEERMKEESV